MEDAFLNTMKYTALTDVGKKRSLNEDAYIADGKLFAVADGMGGHRAGEVASSLALEALAFALSKRAKDTLEEQLEEAVQRANKTVHDKAVRDLDRRGMGTTLTVAVPKSGKLYIGHVGDSRLYRMRDGKLIQLTRDHSLVAQMVESGHLKPEEAEIHPQRSVITRAVGGDNDIKVDIIVEEMLAGDKFLLCTDGLNTMLSDEDITEVLRDKKDLEEACRELVAWANDKGGNDNITVIMFENSKNSPGNKNRLWRS